jgi:hypothetical protein
MALARQLASLRSALLASCARSASTSAAAAAPAAAAAAVLGRPALADMAALAAVGAPVADARHAAALRAALDAPVTPARSADAASASERASALELFRLHNSSLAAAGHTILARVVEADKVKATLDTGMKTAKIAAAELRPESFLSRAPARGAPPARGAHGVRPGDVVAVHLEYEETPEGDMLVSAQAANARRRARAVWRELQRRMARREPVRGRVLNALPGGYAVGVGGLACFLPHGAAGAAGARIGDLQDFRIEQMSAARSNVVLAEWRRAAAREEELRRAAGQRARRPQVPRAPRPLVAEAEGILAALAPAAPAAPTAPATAAAPAAP